MSPERKTERGEQDYSFEDIVRIAQETTLKFGYHIPTLIAKGSHGTGMARFESGDDTHDERMVMMFTAGIDIARSNQVGELWQVILISEAWASVTREDGTFDHSPSEDPERKEILFITRLDLLGEPQTGLAIFEMVRDGEGQLEELEEVVLPEKNKGGPCGNTASRCIRCWIPNGSRTE